jgi:hypothetical protein
MQLTYFENTITVLEGIKAKELPTVKSVKQTIWGSIVFISSVYFMWGQSLQVELNRTPVDLHPNCKKHLKESTKVAIIQLAQMSS